ncbi:MAG TPA: hypothetical protein VGH62_12000 [Bradyrhizobium sp.]|jgi:hypothetical protein
MSSTQAQMERASAKLGLRPASSGDGAQKPKHSANDAIVASLTETLTVVQRIFDLTGQPDLQPIIARAKAALDQG